MKTNKTFAYGILTVIIALAFIACPDEKTPESNPPVANAQAEPTHTLADNLSITLDGTDSTGNISAYAWECETYTADQGTISAEYTKAQVDALITNADTATATVKPRKAGTYEFKLTVTDNDSESDTDTVTVVVEGYTGNRTVTKDVNITFGSFTLPAESISLVPNYEAEWDNDFTKSEYESKITYTITYTFQGDGHTQQYTYPDSVITVAKQTELNYGDNSSLSRPWPAPLYKQTFYYEGTPLKDINGNDVAYTAYIGVQQVSGTEINWVRLNDSQTNPGENRPDCTPITSLPPTQLKFRLIKQIEGTITELP